MRALDDRDYFLRRAAEERARAVSAPEGSARQVHLELADRYHALLVERNAPANRREVEA